MPTPRKIKSLNRDQFTFLIGMRDTLPLVFAATPFAIVYGALAISYGLSPLQIMSMSIFVFAGASQFIAISLIGAATAFPVVLLTVFVVNLRHILYSASLMSEIAKVPQWLRVPMAFWLTDETYAVANNRLLRDPDNSHFVAYYLGSASFMYLSWVLFSWLGMEFGQRVPNLTEWGLDVAMIVAFIGIVIPILKNRADWACALTVTISTLMTYDWQHQTGLLLSSFVAISVGLSIEYQQKQMKFNLKECDSK